MTYRLFVSPFMNAFEEDFITVRTLEQAKQTVETLGFPSYVSFDEKADFGLEFMYWLLEFDRVADYWSYPSRFEWYIHSKTPMRDLIHETFKAYKQYKFR